MPSPVFSSYSLACILTRPPISTSMFKLCLSSNRMPMSGVLPVTAALMCLSCPSQRTVTSWTANSTSSPLARNARPVPTKGNPSSVSNAVDKVRRPLYPVSMTASISRASPWGPAVRGQRLLHSECSPCPGSSSRSSAGTQPQSYRVPGILPAPTGC